MHIGAERDGPILRLTLENPPANALSIAAMEALQEKLDETRHDDSIRVVVSRLGQALLGRA